MRHILVVDDSRFAQVAFVYALKDTDYTVHTVSSGKEALEEARRTRFDLFFLDLKMPDMDGVETLRALQPMRGNAPVYIVTAYRDEFMQRLQEAARDGLQFEVAEKPLDGPAIVNIVEGMLEGPRRDNR
jgi:CheY-like chemotaxis protein